MNRMKLQTVVADNGIGGTTLCIEENGVISAEVILMQRIYSHIDGYLVEETRFTRLIDDMGRMVMHEFSPG